MIQAITYCGHTKLYVAGKRVLVRFRFQLQKQRIKEFGKREMVERLGLNAEHSRMIRLDLDWNSNAANRKTQKKWTKERGKMVEGDHHQIVHKQSLVSGPQMMLNKTQHKIAYLSSCCRSLAFQSATSFS